MIKMKTEIIIGICLIVGFMLGKLYQWYTFMRKLHKLKLLDNDGYIKGERKCQV